MESTVSPRITNKSTVTHIDSLGNDLTIVNAARVSFRNNQDTFNENSDSKLLNYLAKHKHYSPFRHAFMQFHIKCPEFVARQLYKHVVGIECTSTHPIKDHAWNEVSGRYVKICEFYQPYVWRKQHISNKQASDGPLERDKNSAADIEYINTVQTIMKSYNRLLELGVAKEQARSILPMCFMTEFYWTASFQAIMNLIELRNAPDAQEEIRDVATQVEEYVISAFPHAYAAWFLNSTEKK